MLCKFTDYTGNSTFIDLNEVAGLRVGSGKWQEGFISNTIVVLRSGAVFELRNNISEVSEVVNHYKKEHVNG